ncbi:hypothetical protein LTS18_011655 [Coniosporium uncinatum]|uniref:Uncharacterized protein n=1 Tax=Coniosporium uncinatum TaxID=93489 RepID=A0ACC3DZ15_9PEZI|nr:hypothetical protein LTS18_011655 [Coniosporium uncinatum]
MHLNRQIRLESLSLFFSTKLFVPSARCALDAFMTGLTPEALKHVQRITVTDFKFTDWWRIVGGTEGTGGEDTVHGLRLLASRCTNLKGLTVRVGGCLMAELPNSDVSRVFRVVRRLPSASELLFAFPVISALLEVRGLAKVELDLSAGKYGGCAKHVKAQELYSVREVEGGCKADANSAAEKRRTRVMVMALGGEGKSMEREVEAEVEAEVGSEVVVRGKRAFSLPEAEG